MERGEIECEVIGISDSSEMDFSDEVEEEFSAVMENVKSEVDSKPVISPEVFEEYLQYYEVSPSPVISPEVFEEYSQYYEVSPPLRCRLCAIPDNDMVDIFNSNKTDQSIIEKIERCLPIVVRETDPLSKHACRSCLASLELCYQFHKTVAKAEQQLLALERPTKEPRNRESPIRSNNEKPLKQSSDVKTSSNKRRTVVVKSNVKLVNLASRSPRLCNAKTLGNNNSNTESSRHSSDAQSSIGKCYSVQHSSAPIFNQENTCDVEVLENAESTIFRSQARKKVVHNPVEPDIHEVRYSNVEAGYGCDFCPKKFNSKDELVVHRKIHFRKVPYSLKLSARGKRISRKKSMTQDPDNHSEATNNRYSVCNKLLNSSSSGNSLAVANSIQKWQCATCTESFWKIGDLNRHLKLCKLQNPSP